MPSHGAGFGGLILVASSAALASRCALGSASSLVDCHQCINKYFVDLACDQVSDLLVTFLLGERTYVVGSLLKLVDLQSSSLLVVIVRIESLTEPLRHDPGGAGGSSTQVRRGIE
jgi:hypothetical protein